MITHIAIRAGAPRTACGIPDSNRITYASDTEATCKRCIKTLHTSQGCCKMTDDDRKAVENAQRNKTFAFY